MSTEDDIRELLTTCLMCGESVPAGPGGDKPDLVTMLMDRPNYPWGLFSHCIKLGLLTGRIKNSSGIEVHYVTQKGKDLIL